MSAKQGEDHSPWASATGAEGKVLEADAGNIVSSLSYHHKMPIGILSRNQEGAISGSQSSAPATKRARE